MIEETEIQIFYPVYPKPTIGKSTKKGKVTAVLCIQ